MKVLRLFSLLISIVFIAGACDIIEAPYFKQTFDISLDEQCVLDAATIEPFGPSFNYEKKVLLEEMTGHKCGFCPPASKKAYDLATVKYPGKIALVLIHAGPLSNFVPGGDKYSTNFTTEAGDELYSAFNTLGAVPYGMIDRVDKSNNANSWETSVVERLQESADAGIRIFNCYNADSQSVTTVIGVKYLVDASPDEHLSVILVEDKIVDWQKDYGVSGNNPDLPDYVHRDVFRGAINGTWGQPISDTDITKNSQYTLSYSYPIDPDFDVANCKIVAFIHNQTTYEVRQVEEAPLVQ